MFSASDIDSEGRNIHYDDSSWNINDLWLTMNQKDWFDDCWR